MRKANRKTPQRLSLTSNGGGLNISRTPPSASSSSASAKGSSAKTCRLHCDLYCHKGVEEVCSSEEEEIAVDDFENMGHKAEDHEIEATSQGTKT